MVINIQLVNYHKVCMMKTSTTRPCVLIVEDEPELRAMYAEWLTDDYEVATAKDSLEALETIDDATDVILLDRKLPESRGEDLMPHIRNLAPECQIAMVTSVEPEWETLEMEFDAYIEKPIRQEDIRVLVHALCEGNDQAIAKRNDATL